MSGPKYVHIIEVHCNNKDCARGIVMLKLTTASHVLSAIAELLVIVSEKQP